MISMQEMPEKAPAGNHIRYFLSLELLADELHCCVFSLLVMDFVRVHL